MIRYRAKQGDVLDAICKAHYGAEAAVTAVLEANPGLADSGPVLPAGRVILLPDLPQAAGNKRQPVRLWS